MNCFLGDLLWDLVVEGALLVVCGQCAGNLLTWYRVVTAVSRLQIEVGIKTDSGELSESMRSNFKKSSKKASASSNLSRDKMPFSTLTVVTLLFLFASVSGEFVTCEQDQNEREWRNISGPGECNTQTTQETPDSTAKQNRFHHLIRQQLIK